MPHNLELKARIASPDETERAARQSGARHSGILHQVDTYFVVPNGRMKLREFSDGSAELIVYERPDDTPERWSRYQKLPVTDPRGLKGLLGQVFGVLVEVRKVRVVYQIENARIHIDRVDGLGAFIEFEVQDSGREQSEKMMLRLRSLFSIRDEHIVRGSYSDLILQGKTGVGEA